MTAPQYVGYAMLQTSAITTVVSQRIYHGMRPEGTAVPSINYYELPGTRTYGYVSQPYSINCRASTAGAARSLANLVINLFSGTSATGIAGTLNGFTVGRCSLRADQGLLPEPEDNIFNAPVEITLVYGLDTVS